MVRKLFNRFVLNRLEPAVAHQGSAERMIPSFMDVERPIYFSELHDESLDQQADSFYVKQGDVVDQCTMLKFNILCTYVLGF